MAEVFEPTTIRAQASDGSCAACEDAPHGGHQPIEFDRLGVEIVTPCRDRFITLTGQRMRRESNDGDVAGFRIVPEPSCRLPAINDGHLKVHQNDVWLFRSRHLTALLAILRGQYLEIAEQLEPHLEHVDVVVVIFDVKHFGHDAASTPRVTGMLRMIRRMCSTRSAGWNLSLTNTDCTPEFSRARSFASRSSEVITMTGMSRQASPSARRRRPQSHPSQASSGRARSRPAFRLGERIVFRHVDTCRSC
jgi:hypothetical protein